MIFGWVNSGKNEMKKVLFVIPSLGGGGAERMFIKVVNWVIESFEDIEPIVLLITNKGVNYSKLPLTVKVDILNVKRIPFSFFKIANYIKNSKPDLVFCTITQLNIVLSLVKFFIRFKLITRETNVITEEFKTKGYPAFYNWLYRFSLKSSDYVIFQSADMAEDALRFATIRSYKIINNSIDVDMFNINKKKKLSKKIKIICIGRLEKQKGYDLLIDSIIKFKPNVDCKIDIYGEGSEFEYLTNKIRQHDLSRLIELKGFCDNIKNVIKDYDLFILSSRHEGFPNAMLEALSNGVPAWSVNCKGGINEIINRKNGRIFNNTDELILELQNFKIADYNAQNMYIDLYERYSDVKIKSEYVRVFKFFIL